MGHGAAGRAIKHVGRTPKNSMTFQTLAGAAYRALTFPKDGPSLYDLCDPLLLRPNGGDPHLAKFYKTALANPALRPLLRRTLLLATAPLAIAPVVLLRDMGPLPGTKLRHTVWRKGLRLVISDTGRPIKPADFDSPGGMITVIPEGFQDNDDALVKATVIIIKFEPGEIEFPTNKKWVVENIVAYSKICTHVGCPVALYEQTTHHILCPCHQSTFDAPRGAQVLFGPANRPLPQLPMGVNSEGYLVALSDFKVPVGPAFWERG